MEKSLTTIGQDDPVSEYNSRLWQTGDEEKREQVRKNSKRRTNYYSNIYVVKDPGNPAAEGKVWLYRYGKTVFEMINDAMSPKFQGDVAVNPFDLWEGASLDLRIYKADNFSKYDKSRFLPPAALFDDDAKMEAVWNQCYPLRPFVTDGFRSYDELRAKLDRVLGIGAQAPTDIPFETTTKPNPSLPSTPPWDAPSSSPAPAREAAAPVAEEKAPVEMDTSADDDIQFFNDLKSR